MSRLYWLPLAAMVLALGGWCEAKVHIKPDANTLWIEDGAGLETGSGKSDTYWNSDSLTMEEAAGGGIVLKPTENPRKQTTIRRLPSSAEYPFMVTEVAAVSPHPKGNRGFGTPRPFRPGFLGMHMGHDVQTGLWVHRFVLDSAKVQPMELYRWDVYGNDVTVKSVRMVKNPEYRIDIESAVLKEKGRIALGDDVTFRVMMKEAAEDVTLSFFDAYRMRQISLNGQQKLQLKPVDGESKVWTVTLKIASCAGDERKDQPFSPGQMVLKAVILGGAIKVPLWSVNDCELHLKP